MSAVVSYTVCIIWSSDRLTFSPCVLQSQCCPISFSRWVVVLCPPDVIALICVSISPSRWSFHLSTTARTWRTTLMTRTTSVIRADRSPGNRTRRGSGWLCPRTGRTSTAPFPVSHIYRATHLCGGWPTSSCVFEDLMLLTAQYGCQAHTRNSVTL